MPSMTRIRHKGLSGQKNIFENFIKVFQLKEVRDNIATLEMVGYRSPTALEEFLMLQRRVKE